MGRFQNECNFIQGTEAVDADLHRAHTVEYVDKVKNDPGLLAAGNDDMLYDENTSNAALLAAGSTIDLINAILTEGNATENGFAVVRPPGHHAAGDHCSGFCYFNNVMVAAFRALDTKKASRILVVDWDVHYHLGTERILENTKYTSEQILVYSMHRYDNANFFPSSTNGKTGTRCEGRVVNTGFNQTGTDDLYTKTLESFIQKYRDRYGSPDLIIVSAGFDAAKGDPIGGYDLTPDGYRKMTRMLKELCPRVAIVLEGGYNLEMIPRCAEACVEALIED